MKTSYNVLLIDDHPFTIEAFESALRHIENQDKNLTLILRVQMIAKLHFYKYIKNHIPKI
jgi:hypothetical protein